MAFAADGLQAAIGQFGVAGDRLRFDANLRQGRTIVGDGLLDLRQFGLDLAGRRQCLQRRLGFGAGRACFIAAGAGALLRFLQRGNARRIAGDLALGGDVVFARRVGKLLGLAPAGARLDLGGGGGGARGFRCLQRAHVVFHLGARGVQFGFDGCEAAAFGKPPCRAGRRMPRRRKAVPPPVIAFTRDQPLARLEQADEPRSVGAIDDADLLQPPGELRGRPHKVRQWLRAFRQYRIGRIDFGARPAHRRRRIDRRVEFVAKRGAERLFVAFVDAERVHHRRPEILALDRQQLADGLGLGFQALHALFGGGQRCPRGVDLVARLRVRGFRRPRGFFGFAERHLRLHQNFGERLEIRRAVARRGKAGLDIGKLRLKLCRALRMTLHRAVELIAPRRQIGQRTSQFGEAFFRGRQRRFRRGQPIVDAAQLCGALLRFGLEGCFLGVEPLQGDGSIGRKRALALQIGGVLREPAIELGDALLRQGLFALERIAGDKQALQSRGGAGFGLAQSRQLGGDFGLPGADDGLLAGALGDDADRFVLGALGFGGFELRRGPAQMLQQRFRAPHLARDIAITHRLAGLGLERGDLGGELADDVFGARQVLFGRLEPQLGLVPAHMQSGNAGGFFQQAAALLGPRRNDLADAALVDQRRRARAGGGVGEQHVDVARAHLAAVDPEGRALLAQDPARDFQRVVLVERRRRLVVGVIDQHADFGVIARRASGVAGEDHVVHLGGAHGLVRGFAHDPAHGFHQIGFAAAVRADHAGQSGFDLEVGRFNEGLESDETQTRELHSLLCPSCPLRRRNKLWAARALEAQALGVPHRPGE